LVISGGELLVAPTIDTVVGVNLRSAVEESGTLSFGSDVYCVRFRQKFTLEDVIGSYACSLDALACV
jgi:hypothetical protein